MNSANLTTSSSAALEPILSMDMGLTGAQIFKFMLGTELYGVTVISCRRDPRLGKTYADPESAAFC